MLGKNPIDSQEPSVGYIHPEAAFLYLGQCDFGPQNGRLSVDNSCFRNGSLENSID
jgi:hypothetical protein